MRTFYVYLGSHTGICVDEQMPNIFCIKARNKQDAVKRIIKKFPDCNKQEVRDDNYVWTKIIDLDEPSIYHT